MKEIRRITEDYVNEFLTPDQYLSAMEEQLRLVGANKGLIDTVNQVLKPLADYVCNIVATNNVNRDTIEGYFVETPNIEL